MKYLKWCILVVALLAVAVVGCGDDEDENGLAVRLVNTGSGDLDVQYGNGGPTISFCYADGGCEEISGGTFVSVVEGASMVIDQSEADREAVGVIVGFEVTEGSGTAEIVSGRAYMDDGWPEFDVGSVLETTEEFSAGDTFSYTWGETD